jgi:hypothetical protein
MCTELKSERQYEAGSIIVHRSPGIRGCTTCLPILILPGFLSKAAGAKAAGAKASMAGVPLHYHAFAHCGGASQHHVHIHTAFVFFSGLLEMSESTLLGLSATLAQPWTKIEKNISRWLKTGRKHASGECTFKEHNDSPLHSTKSFVTSNGRKTDFTTASIRSLLIQSSCKKSPGSTLGFLFVLICAVGFGMSQNQTGSATSSRPTDTSESGTSASSDSIGT